VALCYRPWSTVLSYRWWVENHSKPLPAGYKKKCFALLWWFVCFSSTPFLIMFPPNAPKVIYLTPLWTIYQLTYHSANNGLQHQRKKPKFSCTFRRPLWLQPIQRWLRNSTPPQTIQLKIRLTGTNISSGNSIVYRSTYGRIAIADKNHIYETSRRTEFHSRHGSRNWLKTFNLLSFQEFWKALYVAPQKQLCLYSASAVNPFQAPTSLNHRPEDIKSNGIKSSWMLYCRMVICNGLMYGNWQPPNVSNVIRLAFRM